MALVKPVIFQVVGYQNSGKTTVMLDLIKRLKSEDINVVSIKHHGHGGKPEVISNKDSSRHLDSGALASIVEGDGGLLLQAEKALWTLEEKIHLASFFNPHVILIEGYKKGPYPKLLLVRNRDDLELLNRLDNIQVVITWEEMLSVQQDFFSETPWFHLTDKRAIDWATIYLKRHL